MHLTTFYIYAV